MIQDMGEWFRRGDNLEEVRIRLNFIGSHPDMRGEVKRHGFKIVRMMVKSPIKRTWGRRKERLNELQLAEVSELLDVDRYTLANICAIIRARGWANVYYPWQFEELLLRSGYAWRYGIVENSDLNYQIQTESGTM